MSEHSYFASLTPLGKLISRFSSSSPWLVSGFPSHRFVFNVAPIRTLLLEGRGTNNWARSCYCIGCAFTPLWFVHSLTHHFLGNLLAGLVMLYYWKKKEVRLKYQVCILEKSNKFLFELSGQVSNAIPIWHPSCSPLGSTLAYWSDRELCCLRRRGFILSRDNF